MVVLKNEKGNIPPIMQTSVVGLSTAMSLSACIFFFFLLGLFLYTVNIKL